MPKARAHVSSAIHSPASEAPLPSDCRAVCHRAASHALVHAPDLTLRNAPGGTVYNQSDSKLSLVDVKKIRSLFYFHLSSDCTEHEDIYFSKNVQIYKKGFDNVADTQP